MKRRESGEKKSPSKCVCHVALMVGMLLRGRRLYRRVNTVGDAIGFLSGVYDTTDAGCLPCGEDSSEQGVKRGKSREEKSPPNCWVLVSAMR